VEIIRKLICKKCGGDSFSFVWRFKDESEEYRAYFCHDGIGFELEDAIIKCVKCGTEAQYEEEDFLLIKQVKP